MSDKYPYDPIKAKLCAKLGHKWMAYDFGVDKCLRCNKEGYDYGSDLDRIQKEAMEKHDVFHV